MLGTAYVTYSVPNKIPIAFHNGSNYDYQFIIKGLAEKFGKYITFTVPIEKEVRRTDKNGEEITKHISCRLKVIDTARFMESSLSSLINNLSEGIHKIKCKHGHDDKKCKTVNMI